MHTALFAEKASPVYTRLEIYFLTGRQPLMHCFFLHTDDATSYHISFERSFSGLHTGAIRYVASSLVCM